MENDNQVKDLVARSRDYFLTEDLLPPEERSTVYDLGEEFAKTKKNKNVLVILLVISYITIITLGTAFFTFYIGQQNKKIEVEIDDFQALNLVELMNQQKQREVKLAQLREELKALQTAYTNALDMVDKQAEAEASAIRASNITKTEKDAAVTNAYAQAQKEKERIAAEYEPKIASKEKEIRDLDRKIRAEKAKLQRQMERTQEVVDNTKKLQELLKEKQEEEHKKRVTEMESEHKQDITKMEKEVSSVKTEAEKKMEEVNKEANEKLSEAEKEKQAAAAAVAAKYNPPLPDVKDAIARGLATSGNGATRAYHPVFDRESIISKTAYSNLTENISAQQALVTRLRQVPYQSDVARALNAIDNLTSAIAGQYEALWFELAKNVEEKNHQVKELSYALGEDGENRMAEREKQHLTVERYNYALAHYAARMQEDGFVIDARNTDAIVVFIRDSAVAKYASATGTLAYIFRSGTGGNVPVAKIRVFIGQDEITAQLVPDNTFATETIVPFDTLMLAQE